MPQGAGHIVGRNGKMSVQSQGPRNVPVSRRVRTSAEAPHGTMLLGDVPHRPLDRAILLADPAVPARADYCNLPGLGGRHVR